MLTNNPDHDWLSLLGNHYRIRAVKICQWSMRTPGGLIPARVFPGGTRGWPCKSTIDMRFSATSFSRLLEETQTHPSGGDLTEFAGKVARTLEVLLSEHPSSQTSIP